MGTDAKAIFRKKEKRVLQRGGMRRPEAPFRRVSRFRRGKGGNSGAMAGLITFEREKKNLV